MKIALFGKMRSGKNTVADILVKDYQFTEFAFATGIGNIIKEYFPKEWAKGKPRRHYQQIGQELRKLDKEVWINYLLESVKESGAEMVVVTDGRQQNEARRLREEGYTIIKVECPEEIRIQRVKDSGDVFTPEQLSHETELAVDTIEADYTIINDKSLAYLENEVMYLMVRLLANELGVAVDMAYFILEQRRIKVEEDLGGGVID